jgi:microcystin-dependent protein
MARKQLGAAPSGSTDAATKGYVDGRAVPSGAILDFAGSAAPTGWLLCDGTAVSRATYAALYAVISTTYGAGDGSSTFNLPNFKGRVALGVGDSTAAGHTSHTLASSGGEETHVLTKAELPASRLNVMVNPTPDALYLDNVASGVGKFGINSATTGPALLTEPMGSGTAHNNLPPFLTVTKIIKT